MRMRNVFFLTLFVCFLFSSSSIYAIDIIHRLGVSSSGATTFSGLTGSVTAAQLPATATAFTVGSFTVTGQATLPANETIAGSKTVTTAANQDQTYVIQGAGTFTITGSGSTKIQTTGGIDIGTLTSIIGVPRVLDYTRTVVNVSSGSTTTFYTGTISANALGNNGYLDFNAILATPNNASANEQFGLKIDGVGVVGGTVTAGAASVACYYKLRIIMAGTTSAMLIRPSVGMFGWSSTGLGAGGTTTTAYNDTVSHTFSFVAAALGGTGTVSLVEGEAVATYIP